MISKETYVTRNFQKISGKRWELYVITRIIHLLNDHDIEYLCQQYINPPKNKDYYLADLAFQSLKLYLEIDEGQHGDKNHQFADIKRDAEILEATDWECKRIEVYIMENGIKKDKDLISLNKEIDNFVEYIRSKKTKLIKLGHKITWNYYDKFKPETYIKKKKFNVSDNVALLNHKDVLKLFGYQKGHYQRAVWNIDKFNQMVWFPKLYPNSDWVNNFDDETGIIHQYRKDLKSHPVPNANDPDRIVFAQTLYKFFGIFKTELSMTNSVHHYFKRISQQIDLNKYS